MKFYIVDCFAEEKYQGNELLVIKADRPINDIEQQQIAREINFSETAFILSDKLENGGYNVRIWTPNTGEVPFAGHPVLGTAHVIREIMENGADSEIILNLKVGPIRVGKSEKGQVMFQNPPIFGEETDKTEICKVFGLEPEQISAAYPVQWVSTGLEAVIVPLNSREALKNIKADRHAFEEYIKKHPKNYCNHLFFADTGENTFTVRCIMEDLIEDPATGSANGDLAGYLLKHDYFGKQNISYTVIQGEDMGRKSFLYVCAFHKDDDWTVEVGGNCYVVAEGKWE